MSRVWRVVPRSWIAYTYGHTTSNIISKRQGTAAALESWNATPCGGACWIWRATAWGTAKPLAAAKLPRDCVKPASQKSSITRRVTRCQTYKTKCSALRQQIDQETPFDSMCAGPGVYFRSASWTYASSPKRRAGAPSCHSRSSHRSPRRVWFVRMTRSGNLLASFGNQTAVSSVHIFQMRTDLMNSSEDCTGDCLTMVDYHRTVPNSPRQSQMQTVDDESTLWEGLELYNSIIL